MISLVAFLGNYGQNYELTRHNAAWLFGDSLPFASKLYWQSGFKGSYATVSMADFNQWAYEYKLALNKDGHQLVVPASAPGKIYFLRPETYMNLSGESVAAFSSFYKLKPEEILVIHDELELPCGTISLKWSGGLGGHNGLRSVKKSLGTADFWRLRFGIGRPEHNNIADYVLGRFTENEQSLLSQTFSLGSILFARLILSSDPARLLPEWNKKKNSGLTGEFLDNYLAWREVHGYPPPEKDVNAHWKETVDERMKFYMKESERTGKIAQISETAAAFNRLYETIGVLRAPGGCPWDRDQTPLSMRRDLIEETFEAVDAITSDDSLHAAEELGDVLLNASLIAYMYEQQGDFSIASMLNELCNKLIRRHPHVFPDSDGQSCVTVPVRDPESVLNQWDRIKETVEGRGQRKTILDEVPAGFPPLMRAYKLQKKAAKRGFDWQNLELVIEKIQEEFGEVQEAADEVEAGSIKPFSAKSDAEKDSSFLHVEEELGDLLFAVVDYCRHFGVDPSVALSRTNKKFYDRFSYVEQKMKESDIPMDNNNLARMEGFWNEAKAFELKKNKVDNELRF